MKKKRIWITYLVAAVIAAAIAGMAISFEISTYGTDTVLLMHFISDGAFTSAVMFLGCAALTFIAEAGGFYGLSYLGYTVVCLFSIRKERLENRKNYFDYCLDKKAKQKERGKSALKWVLLFEGLGCLLLSVIFAVLFYRLSGLPISQGM